MVPCIILQYTSMTMFMIEVVIERKNVLDLASTAPLYVIVSQGLYYLTQLGTWMYSLAPIAEVLVRKFILHQECKLILPYSCKYPFDPTDNWLVYTLVYIFQLYCMFRFIFAYVSTDIIMVTLCSHLVTGFTLLSEDLLHIKTAPNKSSDGDIDEVAEFVKKHQTLILLCKQLDRIFNKINFVKLLFATVIACFFAFSAKVTQGTIMFINCLAVPGMLVPEFIICYYSQLLAIESVGVAHAAYNSSWYKGGTHHQKSIWFIIQRAQIPCSLTSLKYSPINLNTCSKVLSTTWSYFTLISSIYEEGK